MTLNRVTNLAKFEGNKILKKMLTKAFYGSSDPVYSSNPIKHNNSLQGSAFAHNCAQKQNFH